MHNTMVVWGEKWLDKKMKEKACGTKCNKYNADPNSGFLRGRERIYVIHILPGYLLVLYHCIPEYEGLCGGRMVRGRDQVAELLLQQGTKLVSATGYSQPRPHLHTQSDPNKKRKKTTKKFFPNYDIKKMNNKNPRSPDKTVYIQNSMSYTRPVKRRERPKILLPIVEQTVSGDQTSAITLNEVQVEQEGVISTSTVPNQPLKRKEVVDENVRPGKRFKRQERGLESQGSKRKIRGGRDNGLYVQCCNPACQTWRQVREYQSGSEVPQYWVCSMNRDALNRVCGKGGNHFSGSEVKLKYSVGTLVWAKLQGYPWWPGMIDYSPDSDEYFWVDEEISQTDPARYNVNFFEREQEGSWAWINTDCIRQDSVEEPAASVISSHQMKINLVQSIRLASQARTLSVEERLAKFSLSRNGIKEGENSCNGNSNNAKGTKSTISNLEAVTNKKNTEPPRIVSLDKLKPEQLFTNCNPCWEKVYNKPPLPSDVLITLAVRNLDPDNHTGASFSSIVAFLSIHFPYFNRNIEECKDMVRKAYDINSKVRANRGDWSDRFFQRSGFSFSVRNGSGSSIPDKKTRRIQPLASINCMFFVVVQCIFSKNNYSTLHVL